MGARPVPAQRGQEEKVAPWLAGGGWIQWPRPPTPSIHRGATGPPISHRGWPGGFSIHGESGSTFLPYGKCQFGRATRNDCRGVKSTRSSATTSSHATQLPAARFKSSGLPNAGACRREHKRGNPYTPKPVGINPISPYRKTFSLQLDSNSYRPPAHHAQGGLDRRSHDLLELLAEWSARVEHAGHSQVVRGNRVDQVFLQCVL